MLPFDLGQILGPLFGAIAAYAAIRADLAALRARVDMLETALGRAHARIDDCINRH